MLGVDRDSREWQAFWPAVAFVLGCLAGGIASGFALSVLVGLGLGWAPHWTAIVVGVCIAVVAIAKHLVQGSASLPQRRSQIDQSVFEDSLVIGGWVFGLQYGSGVRTYVTSSAPYILVGVLCAIRPHWTQFVACGLGFGVGRAAPVVHQVFSQRGDWTAALEQQKSLLERLAPLGLLLYLAPLAWSLAS